jgi:hypothetical protein
MKRPGKKSANNSRFRPGTKGECEAQLWEFTGPSGFVDENDAPEVHWVAAESLEAALRYMRQRYDDFVIIEARFLDMIPLVCDSSSAATEFRPAQCLASVENRVIWLWQ